MKYSLCLTNFNRYEMLIDSFSKVLDDPRIDEVIISDDASDPEITAKLLSYFALNEKVKIHFHLENVGMFRNKCRALSYAKNDWCILLDSDNEISKSYLDAMDWENAETPLKEKTIYAPCFAAPQFDFRMFAGCEYSLGTITQLLNESMGAVLLNCCNYVINKKYFVTNDHPDIRSADSIWIMYNLLKAGFTVKVTPNLIYQHRVHPGSGFLDGVDYNLAMAESIKQMILMESEIFNKKNK